MDIAYVEMGLISVFLCLIIYHQQKQNREDIFGSGAFNRIIWLTVVVLILDTWSWMMLHGLMYQNYWLHTIVLCVYAVCHTWLPMELLRYCVDYNSRKPGRRTGWLLKLPFAIAAVMYLINAVYPFAFRILEDGSFERMPLYPIATVWSMLYIGVCVAVSGVICQRSADKDRITSRHLLVFSIIGFIGASLGVLFDSFSIWPVIALDIVYLYLNVQSKREQELDVLAFKDSLTGLRNATAYRYYVNELEQKIQAGIAEFAVIVFDVNGLKYTNDHYGHEAGDQLIVQSGRLICRIFQHSPVFRIGGDEFVAILEGEDYRNGRYLLRSFDYSLKMTFIRVPDGELQVSIARGMECYQSGEGMHYLDVFQKADKAMYQNKMLMKEK